MYTWAWLDRVTKLYEAGKVTTREIARATAITWLRARGLWLEAKRKSYGP